MAPGTTIRMVRIAKQTMSSTRVNPAVPFVPFSLLEKGDSLLTCSILRWLRGLVLYGYTAAAVHMGKSRTRYLFRPYRACRGLCGGDTPLGGWESCRKRPSAPMAGKCSGGPFVSIQWVINAFPR